MPRKKNQESVKQDFFRRLDRGSDIDLAASKAGVDPSLVVDFLVEYRKTESDEKMHLEAMHAAISTLKEIASGGVDEDRVRCDAAKALLKFASDNLKNKTDKESSSKSMLINVQNDNDTLWDF